MSETIEVMPDVVETTPEIEVETTPAPVVEPDHRYEYQPTDEQGRPIGGKQVIVYKTPDELTAKLTEQTTLLIRKLRAETRKNRLGIADRDAVGEEAPKFSEPPVFNQKELSADEKVSLALKLGVSPEDFDSATDELFEIKFGMNPAALRTTLQEIQQDQINRKALAEAEKFKALNPDYYLCPENAEAIANWMARYNLAPVCANFQRAYTMLRDAGIMVDKPSPVVPVSNRAEETSSEPVVLESAPEVVPEAAPEITPVEPTVSKARVHVPVSLSRTNTEESGTPTASVSDITYDVIVNGQKRRLTGLAAINAMPSDEYRRRTLSDPSFSRKEAALEKEAAARRQRR